MYYAYLAKIVEIGRFMELSCKDLYANLDLGHGIPVVLVPRWSEKFRPSLAPRLVYPPMTQAMEKHVLTSDNGRRSRPV